MRLAARRELRRFTKRVLAIGCVLAIHGCSPGNSSGGDNVSSEAQNASALRESQPASPRTQCLLECRNDANTEWKVCVKEAEGDPEEVKACNDERKDALSACNASCRSEEPPEPTIPGR